MNSVTRDTKISDILTRHGLKDIAIEIDSVTGETRLFNVTHLMPATSATEAHEAIEDVGNCISELRDSAIKVIAEDDHIELRAMFYHDRPSDIIVGVADESERFGYTVPGTASSLTDIIALKKRRYQSH